MKFSGMKCSVGQVRDFSIFTRQACAALCHEGSEMQREFREYSETPVAIVCLPWWPAAWAATHVWQDMQTLEGYTNPHYRRRGLQRFAASGLVAAGLLDIRQVVAVFSPDCVGLTRSLGFADVKLFRRTGSNDWIEVSL